MTKLAGPLSPDSHNTTMEVKIGHAATLLVVELAWQDKVSDLDLFVRSPNFCQVPPLLYLVCLQNAYFGDSKGTGVWRSDGGLPTQSDSPARIRLNEQDIKSVGCPDVCPWSMEVQAKASQGTPFDLYATVFYGAPPPDDYTAIPTT